MIRWGLVGTGAIASKRAGTGLVDAHNSKLIAVCDVIEEAVQTFAGRFNVPHVYTSFDELLTNEEIDAVYLATPIFLHAPQAIQALRAGKHVLVEKPMALSVAEGEEMVQVA